jgi:D-alanyl-D-alanine carboxypeptidase/D-alanyl-D-alanine-endopeptidase (penicillin-binding protein 4)
VPQDAVAVSIHELGTGRKVLAHRAQAAMNPASLAKLMTTAAALDMLGPAWTWSTPVWVQGNLRDGVLEGSVHIKGSGDPKLVVERVWLLLRRLQQMGVRDIRGDIVLDGSAFAAAEGGSADFDGESSRPYNVKARSPAAQLQGRGLHLRARPGAAASPPWLPIRRWPALAVDRTVPLASRPLRRLAHRVEGHLRRRPHTFLPATMPPAAASRPGRWPTPSPASYNARLIDGLWREMGGRLAGVGARRAGARRPGPASSSAHPRCWRWCARSTSSATT